MLNILNRFAWIISIITWISIFAIGNDLFIIALFSIFITKFILSKNFIKNNILKNEQLAPDSMESGLKETDSNKIQDNSNEIKDLYKNEVDIYEKNDWEKEKDELEIVEEQDKLEIVEEPSKIWIFISSFFAENLIAKIGWILISIWVIFLMSLVYTQVWEIAKIIIWFWIWFWVYFIWSILEKKWFKTEAMILFWTWILINYIVILGWRFVIWDNSDWFLSSGITFLFLILNTIFSIVTSFIYKSKNLLLFSTIFTFVIPFLIWNKDITPYLQVLYWLIISMWWLILSNYFKNNKSLDLSKELLFISLVWWNILFLTAPFWDNANYFIIKMIAYNVVTFFTIFLAYKNKLHKYILTLLIISFTFLAFIMFSGSALSSLWILITFIIASLWFLISTSFFLIAWVWIWLIYLLFLPILFVLWFIFIWTTSSALILLPLFLISYLTIFIFWIWNLLTSALKYTFFLIIWVFLTIWNVYLNSSLELNLWVFLVISFTAFLFLISTYYLSSKKDLSFLYSIGTIFSIFILLPILQITQNFVNLSIWALVIFFVVNYITPFINSNLIKNDIINLILGKIFWIIFIGSYLFAYWNEYFPWISLWLWFLLLALIYFSGWYMFFNKIEKSKNQNEIVKINTNFIYTFLAIAISLFSISIALIFAESPAIIAMVWLFQSSIIFFFANKLQKEKIYYAWIILFIIWIAKFLQYLTILWVDIFNSNPDINYFSHIFWNIFILIPIFLNIIFFIKTKFTSIIWVNILHIIWVLIFTFNLSILFLSYMFNFLWYREDFWVLFVFLWILLFIFSILYNLIWNKFTKYVLIFFVFITLFLHIFITNEFINYSLNYIITLIIITIYWIDLLFIKHKKILNYENIINIFWKVILLYLFIITSIYVFYITNNAFFLTIYWWALSLIWINIWIFKKYKTLRIFWLYLIIITLWKIVFYDIWNSIDHLIIRVIAFIFVWWIMVYINILYSKNKLSFKDDLIFEEKNK